MKPSTLFLTLVGTFVFLALFGLPIVVFCAGILATMGLVSVTLAPTLVKVGAAWGPYVFLFLIAVFILYGVSQFVTAGRSKRRHLR